MGALDPQGWLERRRYVERGVSGNGGPARGRFGSAPGNYDGGGAAPRCLARAHWPLSPTRLMPIRHRASQPRGDCSDDDSFISRSCVSQDSSQAWQGLLRVGDDARSARKHHRTGRIVHSARCGHDRFAGKTSNHKLQTVDAKRPRALVARTLAGIRDIYALVRPHLIHKCFFRF